MVFLSLYLPDVRLPAAFIAVSLAGGLLLARMFVRRRTFSASLTKHPAFAGRRASCRALCS